MEIIGPCLTETMEPRFGDDLSLYTPDDWEVELFKKLLAKAAVKAYIYADQAVRRKEKGG